MNEKYGEYKALTKVGGGSFGNVYLAVKEGENIGYSLKVMEKEQIEKEDLDKVWDIFYTTDKARTDRMSNSGVGLSVVKSILNAHKAEYGCTSGDNGTEFKFTLPARESA